MRKRVCIVSISDKLGGAEQVLLNLARFLSKDKFITIFFFKSQSNQLWSDELNENVNIIYLNNSLFLFLNLVKKQDFSLVFSSHLMINSLLGSLRTIGVLRTKKLIVRESTQVFGRYQGFKLVKYKMAYYFGYKKLDLVICQTDRMAENLKKNVQYLFERTKVKVIPNPFNSLLSDLTDEIIKFKNDYIVSAGRLIPEKGFDILIDAFSQIKIKHPDLNLVILGEGEKRNELEQQIKAYDLTGSVFLPGFVDNVYPYFKEAKLCVVSSRIEGFPNVLLQMMSQNHKVVSTLCAGGIEDLPGVFKANTNDVSSLHTTIVMALETDTINNRAIFDNLLAERSIENFVATIDRYLQNA